MTKPDPDSCPCDLCGSDAYTPLTVARKYVGGGQVPVVCKTCGFLYVPRRRRDRFCI